jgi:Xaa-Pro dipeptidase
MLYYANKGQFPIHKKVLTASPVSYILLYITGGRHSMNTKIKKIIDKMKEEGIDNLIICDGGSIYYLTGCMFHTMHRMCALLLSVDSDPVLYIHEMFPTRGLEDAGVRTHHWKDTDNYIKELYNEFDHTKLLAVD